MKPKTTTALFANALTWLGLMAAFPTAADEFPTYRIVDMGLPAGGWAVSLNDSGQVAGGFPTHEAGKQIDRAFFWDGTSIHEIPPMPGFESGTVSANAMNSHGQVTGVSCIQGPVCRGFVWSTSSVVDIGNLGTEWVWPIAINDSGWVTGASRFADTPSGIWDPFLWNGESMMPFPVSEIFGASLYRISGAGYGINKHGQVAVFVSNGLCGRAALWDQVSISLIGGPSECGMRPELYINDQGLVAGKSNRHAFLWDGTSMRYLTLRWRSGYAFALNQTGMVTGSGYDDTYAGFGFVWDGSDAVEIKLADDCSTLPYGMNDAGHVVGLCPSDNDFGAFLWIDGTISELRNLIDKRDPLQPYLQLKEATQINNQGQILVWGCDVRNEECKSYILTPWIDDVLSIEIDILPDDQVNTINISSDRRIPVAILSSDLLNALDIDPTTVVFGPNDAPAINSRTSAVDVNQDGASDVMVHFEVRNTGFSCEDTSATLTARTFGGELLKGVGPITVVGCR